MAKAYQLFVYMLAIALLPVLWAYVKAMSSALWAELPGGKVEVHMSEFESTTADPKYLVPSGSGSKVAGFRDDDGFFLTHRELIVSQSGVGQPAVGSS